MVSTFANEKKIVVYVDLMPSLISEIIEVEVPSLPLAELKNPRYQRILL